MWGILLCSRAIAQLQPDSFELAALNEEPRDRDPGELLQRLQAEALREPRLRSERARAWREFTGSAARPLPEFGPQAEAETIRFYEWYLLERPSEVLGTTVLDALAPELLHELHESLAGVFLVEVAGGGEARLRDLQDRAKYDLALHGHRLEVGDLLVGRLYPERDGRYAVSAGAGVSRDARELAAAFERDYHNLTPQRRLAQAEIERIWFQQGPDVAGATRPIEHLEAELATLLTAAGRDPDEAESLLVALRAEARPGRVVGPFLEQLAFDSEVDLTHARDLLLEIWQHYQTRLAAAAEEPPPAARPPAAGKPLGAALAERLEEGLRNHEDLEALFDEIDRTLGDDDEPDLDDADAEDDEDGDGIEALEAAEGDLASLIQEFLWETGRDQGPDAAILAGFHDQQRTSPTPVLDLEQIGGSDLVRFLVQIYLARPAGARVQAVQAAWDTLRRFYEWAEETQGYALRPAVAEAQQAWIDQLDRVHRAGVALAGERPPGRSPGDLLRVTAVAPDHFEVAGGPRQEQWEVPLRAPGLRAGDLLVAGVRRGTHGEPEIDGIAVVLPGAVESLFGG